MAKNRCLDRWVIKAGNKKRASLAPLHADKAEGIKKSENFADVINGCSLMEASGNLLTDHDADAGVIGHPRRPDEDPRVRGQGQKNPENERGRIQLND